MDPSQPQSTTAPPPTAQSAVEDLRPTLRGVPDAIAALIAIPAVGILLANAGGGMATLGAAAFGVGLVVMLAMSAAYHTPTWSPNVLKVMRRLDHTAIFFLIAGSYAPFCLATSWTQGQMILLLVLGFCLLGVLRIFLWPKAGRAIRALSYVAVGLVMLPFAPDLYQAVGPRVVTLTAVGGALYILGAAVYIAKWPNPSPRHYGCQEVFHLFVFAAAACHYAAVWEVVTTSSAPL